MIFLVEITSSSSSVSYFKMLNAFLLFVLFGRPICREIDATSEEYAGTEPHQTFVRKIFFSSNIYIIICYPFF